MGDFLSEQYYNTLPPSVAAVEEALRYNGKIWGIGTMEWLPIYGYQNDMVFTIYNRTWSRNTAWRIPGNCT